MFEGTARCYAVSSAGEDHVMEVGMALQKSVRPESNSSSSTSGEKIVPRSSGLCWNWDTDYELEVFDHENSYDYFSATYTANMAGHDNSAKKKNPYCYSHRMGDTMPDEKHDIKLRHDAYATRKGSTDSTCSSVSSMTSASVSPDCDNNQFSSPKSDVNFDIHDIYTHQNLPQDKLLVKCVAPKVYVNHDTLFGYQDDHLSYQPKVISFANTNQFYSFICTTNENHFTYERSRPNTSSSSFTCCSSTSTASYSSLDILSTRGNVSNIQGGFDTSQNTSMMETDCNLENEGKGQKNYYQYHNHNHDHHHQHQHHDNNNDKATENAENFTKLIEKPTKVQNLNAVDVSNQHTVSPLLNGEPTNTDDYLLKRKHPTSSNKEVANKRHHSISSRTGPEATDTAVKQYTCQHCFKEFPRKSNHDSHVRMHSKTKPYSCSFCSKAFVRKSDMNRHERSLHLKSSYKCLGHVGASKWGCGKLYSRKDGLRKHWKMSHSCLKQMIHLNGLQVTHIDDSNFEQLIKHTCLLD